MLGGFATLLASGGTFAMFMFRLFVRLEARVDVLAGEVTNLRGDMTREVAELRADMTREIAKLRGDMTREIAQMRGDVAGLSREVSELRGEFRGRFDTQPAAG